MRHSILANFNYQGIYNQHLRNTVRLKFCGAAQHSSALDPIYNGIQMNTISYFTYLQEFQRNLDVGVFPRRK